MKFLYYILNRKWLTYDLVIFTVFLGSAHLLIYFFVSSYINYGVIIICLNLCINALKKQFKFIKQYEKYFRVLRVFRFLTMLFMLLKFIWTYDWLFYGYCLSMFLFLAFVWFKYRRALKLLSIALIRNRKALKLWGIAFLKHRRASADKATSKKKSR